MTRSIDAATAAWGQDQAAASAIYKRLQTDRMASQRFLQAAGALAAAGLPIDELFDDGALERPEHFLGRPKEGEETADKTDKAASKTSISNMPIQEQALRKLEGKLGSLDIEASDIPRGDAKKIVDGTIEEDDYKKLVADIEKKIAKREKEAAKSKEKEKAGEKEEVKEEAKTEDPAPAKKEEPVKTETVTNEKEPDKKDADTGS